MAALPLLQTLVAVAVSLTTLSVNGFAIFSIVASEALRADMTARLMLSLAISDLGSGLFVSGLSAVALLRFDVVTATPSSSSSTAVMSDAIALFQSCAAIFFANSSVWHLAIVSVVKCVTIANPLNYHRLLTGGRVAAAAAGIWTLNFVYATFPLYVDAGVTFQTVTGLSGFPHATPALVGILIVAFLLPSAVITASNARIFAIVRQHQRTIAPSAAASTSGGLDQVSWNADVGWFLRSVRSARNIFVICIVYWSTFVPTIVTFSWRTRPTWFWFVANWIFVCHSIFNSLLYIVLHKTVRRQIRKVFGDLFHK